MNPSLQGDPPNIELTLMQNSALLMALDLESDGWIGAANHLRKKHFPTVPWDDPAVKATTKEGFQRMLRVHHGSLPPVAPAAQPTLVKPVIRPDQTTA